MGHVFVLGMSAAALAPLIEAQPGRDTGFDAAIDRAGRLTPVPPQALADRHLRSDRQRLEAQRKSVYRSRLWYPLVLIFGLLASSYVALRTDQLLASILVWPVEGAQFTEVGGSSGDPDYRDTMTIVTGGLNRKSGNLIAEALMPSIGGPDTRVFSLVYGSGIYDDDINAKFDALFQRYQPHRLVLVGNSMGGDVVLNIAEHFQQKFADPALYQPRQLVPFLDTVYLDCTPLSTDDVRYSARARADFLTGLTEKVGTDGGAATRLVAEMLVQRRQWSSGRFPFLMIDPDRFAYKWDEVWREKLNPTGVSTQLVKDQYGVIRRFDADRVLAELSSATDVVLLRPDISDNDNTIDDDQVERRLTELTLQHRINLTVLDVPQGSHASAVRDADRYNALISTYQQAAIQRRVAELFR